MTRVSGRGWLLFKKEKRILPCPDPDRAESIIKGFEEEIDCLTLGDVHCFVFYILRYICILVFLKTPIPHY